MQKRQPLALVGAGKVAQSLIGRLPGVLEQLGPVKSFSYRVASRIVNSLRAGRAVCDYTDVGQCRLVLVCVPDEVIGKTVADMISAPVDWTGKVVVLCESWRDSSALRLVADRGAITASLNAAPGFGERLFIVEGSDVAVREIKRLAATRSARIVRLRPSAKPVYMAGLAVAAYSAHLAASSDCLRAAGVPVPVSRSIVHALAAEAIRGFVKAGPRRIAHTAAQDGRSVRDQCSAMLQAHPDLADVYSTLTFAMTGNSPSSTAAAPSSVFGRVHRNDSGVYVIRPTAQWSDRNRIPDI